MEEHGSVSRLVDLWEEGHLIAATASTRSGFADNELNGIRVGLAQAVSNLGPKNSTLEESSTQPNTPRVRGKSKQANTGRSTNKANSDLTHQGGSAITITDDEDEEAIQALRPGEPDEPANITELQTKAAEAHGEIERLVIAVSTKDDEVNKLKCELTNMRLLQAHDEAELEILRTEVKLCTEQLKTALEEKAALEKDLAQSRQREHELLQHLALAQQELRRVQQQNQRQAALEIEHDEQLRHQRNRHGHSEAEALAPQQDLVCQPNAMVRAGARSKPRSRQSSGIERRRSGGGWVYGLISNVAINT